MKSLQTFFLAGQIRLMRRKKNYLGQFMELLRIWWKLRSILQVYSEGFFGKNGRIMNKLFETLLKVEISQDDEIEESKISAAEIFSILLESSAARNFFLSEENLNKLIDKIDVT